MWRKWFYGESAVKVNCLGYDYNNYNPANYDFPYYKLPTTDKCKGMMLDGYIIDPSIFNLEEEDSDGEEYS